MRHMTACTDTAELTELSEIRVLVLLYGCIRERKHRHAVKGAGELALVHYSTQACRHAGTQARRHQASRHTLRRPLDLALACFTFTL